MDCPLYDLVSACLPSLIYPWFPDSHSHCPVHYDSTTVICSFVSLPRHWKCSFLCQKPLPPPPLPTHNGLPNSWGKNKWKVRVASWCPTLCDPLDYISPGSSVHGILQTRILQWVAIPFSKLYPRLYPGSWNVLGYNLGLLVSNNVCMLVWLSGILFS